MTPHTGAITLGSLILGPPHLDLSYWGHHTRTLILGPQHHNPSYWGHLTGDSHTGVITAGSLILGISHHDPSYWAVTPSSFIR